MHEITTSIALPDTLNQLSFLLPKEYSPKAVATALQLVVPAPRNEQEIKEVSCIATIEHTETIYSKIVR